MSAMQQITALETHPQIADLNVNALNDGDLVNVILQRSEVLYDVPKPGRIIRSWEKGNDRPARAMVDQLGPIVAKRAAAVIFTEYQSLRDILREISPKRVADIGCGYAFFDLFVARDLSADLLLIDIENNNRRHFGFQSEGAAYASLNVARRFLEDNGVNGAAIQTLNPTRSKPETATPVDLIVSFLSCGFHYPIDVYLPFIEKALNPGGAGIFDLRRGTAKDQIGKLKQFGSVSDLPSPPKSRRVLLRKNREI